MIMKSARLLGEGALAIPQKYFGHLRMLFNSLLPFGLYGTIMINSFGVLMVHHESWSGHVVMFISFSLASIQLIQVVFGSCVSNRVIGHLLDLVSIPLMMVLSIFVFEGHREIVHGSSVLSYIEHQQVGRSCAIIFFTWNLAAILQAVRWLVTNGVVVYRVIKAVVLWFIEEPPLIPRPKVEQAKKATNADAPAAVDTDAASTTEAVAVQEQGEQAKDTAQVNQDIEAGYEPSEMEQEPKDDERDWELITSANETVN